MEPDGRSLALSGAVALGGSATALALLSSLMLLVLGGLAAGPLGGLGTPTYGARPGVVGDIPPVYLSLYVAAARRYSLDWSVLAAVGKVECDHGRDPDPSCTREGAVNAAGAGGPAQFLAGTWRTYGVDGDGDGRADRWDPADAIFSMANYLRACGAPRNYRRALFAYNHSSSYVALVEHWSAVYRADAPPGSLAGGTAAGVPAGDAGAGWPDRSATNGLSWWAGADVQTIPGSRAVLSPGDGHVALVPQDAPPVVQAMVIAGNELQDLPYGPAGHPDPRGAASEDCSSTVSYVLYRSGTRPISEIVRENPLAQDYTRWGVPGPGRWVTIYSTASPVAHVFIVIAGLRLDTSHDGTDAGPNRFQDGPRWRVLGNIPAWAHWTVRHPPDL